MAGGRHTGQTQQHGAEHHLKHTALGKHAVSQYRDPVMVCTETTLHLDATQCCFPPPPVLMLGVLLLIYTTDDPKPAPTFSLKHYS